MKAQDLQPVLREEQAGSCGMSEGSIVPTKPVNTGRGKGPWFQDANEVAQEEAIDPWVYKEVAYRLERWWQGRQPTGSYHARRSFRQGSVAAVEIGSRSGTCEPAAQLTSAATP
jgi:hypothetical protein